MKKNYNTYLQTSNVIIYIATLSSEFVLNILARNLTLQSELSRGSKLQEQKKPGLQAVRQFFQTIYQLQLQKPKYVRVMPLK